MKESARILGAMIVWLVIGRTPSAAAQEKPIEPDRPDVTNGAHLVEPRRALFELGGIFTRESQGHHETGAPIGIRFGMRDWLEARVGIDTRIGVDAADPEPAGIGSIQLGAKIRIWPDADGVSKLSVLPNVTLARSGDPAVGIIVLTGFDIGSHGHLDVNYGIGALEVEDGPHFVQHLVSGSLSYAATTRWTPYVELFEMSRGEATGTAIVGIDGGVMYGVTPRVAIDGGVQFGTTLAAPSFAAFGGLSFAARRRRHRPTSASAVRGPD